MYTFVCPPWNYNDLASLMRLPSAGPALQVALYIWLTRKIQVEADMDDWSLEKSSVVLAWCAQRSTKATTDEQRNVTVLQLRWITLSWLRVFSSQMVLTPPVTSWTKPQSSGSHETQHVWIVESDSEVPRSLGSINGGIRYLTASLFLQFLQIVGLSLWFSLLLVAIVANRNEPTTMLTVNTCDGRGFKNLDHPQWSILLTCNMNLLSPILKGPSLAEGTSRVQRFLACKQA